MERAIAQTLAEVDVDGGLHFSDDEAQCVAEAVIDEFGADRLVALGALDGLDATGFDWTPDERDFVFATLGSCVDLRAQIAAFFAQDASLTADQADCVGMSYLQSDALPDALFSTEPDPALDARVDEAVSDAYATCLESVRPSG